MQDVKTSGIPRSLTSLLKRLNRTRQDRIDLLLMRGMNNCYSDCQSFILY